VCCGKNDGATRLELARFPMQYPLYKLFVATVAVAILFALLRPHEVATIVATFGASAGLVGLILLGNRKNLDLIWRSAAWTVTGAFVGVMLSPRLGSLVTGAVAGWALGAAYRHPHKKLSVDTPLGFVVHGTALDWALLAVFRFLRRERRNGAREDKGKPVRKEAGSSDESPQ